MQSNQIHLAVASEDKLGEGCIWDAETQSLWWVDIARPSRIQRFTPATGEHKQWISERLLTAIAKRSSGGFVVAGEDGVYSFDPASGAISAFCQPETMLPQNRMNDGACDPQGRFWLGSMMQNIGPAGEDLDITADTGNLFRISADGASTVMASEIGVSNGPCWSPDHKTFYFNDTKKQVIYAYDFHADEGTLSNRRVLNDTRDYGYPDGSTIDAEGYLWSARWEGACVLRIDPKGRIDRVVDIPASRVTCPVFGGDNLDTLYLTTSRAHLNAETLKRYPGQGGVFAVKPGVRGLLKHQFAG